MKAQKNPTEVIRELLVNNFRGNQDQIRQKLEQKGIHVCQSTVSRALKKLGAVKYSSQGQWFYRLTNTEDDVGTNEATNRMVLNISHNDQMVVLKTTPGSAPLVARVIDVKNLKHILGTIAGDDTIFIAPTQSKKMTALVKDLKTLFLGAI